MGLHTGYFSSISMESLTFLLLTTTSRTINLSLSLFLEFYTLTTYLVTRYVNADLTYLNFVVGVVIMFVVFAPLQTWAYSRDRLKHGRGRPEARFLLSLGLVWLFPISLFWFAFTSNGKTSFWSPVVAGAVLEIGDAFLWLNMLNYITDSYPNVAASAVAAFLIPSFLIAAGCVHMG